MTASEALEARKRQVEVAHGPWTAHNIAIADGIFTMSPRLAGDEVKLRRVVQIVSDVCAGQFGGRRVLDLACLEGMYGLEFAMRGATVCAIEGREDNLAKTRFAAEALGLSSVEFHHDDVLNLSKKKYGRFDVVLCLGILYHFDDPEVFEFLERVYEVCDYATVIDTHVASEPRCSVHRDGRTYHGRHFTEHSKDASVEDKERASWASLDNLRSFEFTRPSLYNVLAEVGFTTVYECQVPWEPAKPATRATFVAIKGSEQSPILTPQLASRCTERIPERPLSAAGPSRRLRHLLSRFLPHRVKSAVRLLWRRS